MPSWLAQAQLIFGADHAMARHAAQLALFNGERAFFTLGVGHGQFGANGGDGDFLPGGNIGRTTDNGERLVATDINGGTAQAVGIRVLFAW